MEPFRIHILGCGSALPTLKHSASAQLIEMRGKCFMMDCGEGAQMLWIVRTALHLWYVGTYISVKGFRTRVLRQPV